MNILLKMISLIILLCYITVTRSESYPPERYAFLFPSEPHSAAAVKTNDPLPNQGKELSISLWTYQLNKHNWNTFVSYSVQNQNKAFVLSVSNSTWSWTINGNTAEFTALARMNEWVHYVLTWTSTDGVVKLYVNGELVHNDRHSQVKGTTWNGENGRLIIGQALSPEEEFSKIESFRGEISAVNIWDKELKQADVQSVFNSHEEGNTIAWSKTIWRLANDISVVKSSLPEINWRNKYRQMELTCRGRETAQIQEQNNYFSGVTEQINKVSDVGFGNYGSLQSHMQYPR